jgi:hypothetical protein
MLFVIFNASPFLDRFQFNVAFDYFSMFLNLLGPLFKLKLMHILYNNE